MLAFKRSQLEDATARCLLGSPPTSELRTRIKRLLETDRALGRKQRATDPKLRHYAFFSDEGPGRGTEILFSEYEAFALMVGLRLQQHNWPQSFPIVALRRVKSELQREHARILKQDPKTLFDQEAIFAKARPGDLYVDNTDPVFLTIVSGAVDKNTDEPALAVCRGMEAVSNFIKQQAGRSWTLLELVTPAHQMSQELSKTEPRKRGRT